jgi:hypothetical protein
MRLSRNQRLSECFVSLFIRCSLLLLFCTPSGQIDVVAMLRLRTQLAAFRHLNRNAPVPGALAPASVAAAVDAVDSDLVGDIPVDEFERRQFAAEAATQHAMDGRADELQGAVLILTATHACCSPVDLK